MANNNATQSPNDLLGGAVKVLVEKNGKMVPLASLIGLNPNVSLVDSVRVKVGLMSILEIEVTLDPPLEQAIALLRSGALGLGFSVQKSNKKSSVPSGSLTAFKPDVSIFMNKIAVQLIYGGRKSPWYKGLLLQPEIEISTEGISISLKAIGMLFGASKSMAPVTAEVGTKTKADFLKELFGDDVQLSYSSGAKEILNQPLTRNYTETGSHLDTAKKVLQENACKFIMQGADKHSSKQKVFIKHVSETRQKHVAEFVAYRQINPNLSQYPLMNFSAPVQNILVGYSFGAVLGTSGKGSKDTRIGKVVGNKSFSVSDTIDTYGDRGKAVTNGDDSIAGTAPLGQVSQTGEAGGFSNKDKVKPVIPTATSVFDLLRGYVHDYTDRVFEYDVTSVGVVDLLPGHMVKVTIADIKELSGVYDLTSVEHSLSGSGVETKMSLIRTGGLISAASEGIERAKDNLIQSDQRVKVPSISGLIN